MTASYWQKFSGPLVTALGVLVLALAMTALFHNVPKPRAPGQEGLVLPEQEESLVVDYARVNEDGSVVLSGTATPGATVRLMLDKTHFGEVRADLEGIWTYIHGGRLSPGQHVIGAESLLDGFASQGHPEWILLDILRVDAAADRALGGDQAGVYVFG